MVKFEDITNTFVIKGYSIYIYIAISYSPVIVQICMFSKCPVKGCDRHASSWVFKNKSYPRNSNHIFLGYVEPLIYNTGLSSLIVHDFQGYIYIDTRHQQHQTKMSYLSPKSWRINLGLLQGFPVSLKFQGSILCPVLSRRCTRFEQAAIELPACKITGRCQVGRWWYRSYIYIYIMFAIYILQYYNNNYIMKNDMYKQKAPIRILCNRCTHELEETRRTGFHVGAPNIPIHVLISNQPLVDKRKRKRGWWKIWEGNSLDKYMLSFNFKPSTQIQNVLCWGLDQRIHRVLQEKVSFAVDANIEDQYHLSGVLDLLEHPSSWNMEKLSCWPGKPSSFLLAHYDTTSDIQPRGKFSIPPGVRTHWPRNVRPRGLLSVRPLVPPWERTGVDE